MNKKTKLLAVVLSVVVLFGAIEEIDAACITKAINYNNGICNTKVLNCGNGICDTKVINCGNGICDTKASNCNGGTCDTSSVKDANINCSKKSTAEKATSKSTTKKSKKKKATKKKTTKSTTKKNKKKNTSKKKTTKKKATKKQDKATAKKKTTKKQDKTTAKKEETTKASKPEKTTEEVTTKKAKEETTTKLTTEESQYVQRVVDLVNQERSKAGLNKVSLDNTLKNAAMTRAKETVTSFSHTRPNGTSFSTVLSEYNISYRGAGENIAWGQATPEEVMNGWMNSSGHRANILNANFTKIGVGYYKAANGRKYWSQLFIY